MRWVTSLVGLSRLTRTNVFLFDLFIDVDYFFIIFFCFVFEADLRIRLRELLQFNNHSGKIQSQQKLQTNMGPLKYKSKRK